MAATLFNIVNSGPNNLDVVFDDKRSGVSEFDLELDYVGTPMSMYVFANDCEKKGTPRFMEKAIKYYTLAGDHNVLAAQVRLVEIYAERLDEPNTLLWLEKASQGGDANSQFNMALRLEETAGLKCISLLRKAAKQDHVSAQRKMYCLHKKGFPSGGLEPNVEKALYWINMAVEAGCALSMFTLSSHLYQGEGVEKEETRALELLIKSAQLGEDLAQVAYALTLEEPLERVGWLARAAAKQNRRAFLHLGECYEQGHGVTKDLGRAREWYTKSANAGDVAGQEKLAILCHRESDPDCIVWMEKAANAGSTFAQYNMYRMITDEQVRIGWLIKAAESGASDAQYKLAGRFFEGIGVEKDEVEAASWIHKAAKQNHPNALISPCAAISIRCGLTRTRASESLICFAQSATATSGARQRSCCLRITRRLRARAAVDVVSYRGEDDDLQGLQYGSLLWPRVLHSHVDRAQAALQNLAHRGVRVNFYWDFVGAFNHPIRIK